MTKRRLIPLAVLGVLVQFTSASPAQVAEGDGVAAIVNEQIVTLFEIEKALRLRIKDLANTPESVKKQNWDQILSNRVFEILKQEAAKQAGISLSNEDLINRRTEAIQDLGYTSEDAFREFLRQKGETEEHWNENFKAGEEARAWLLVSSGSIGLRNPQARAKFSLAVTPDDMRAFYRKHQKDRFERKTEARVRVIQVYFRQGSPAERQRVEQLVTGLKTKLETKADFAVLANKNSQHPSKDKGGEMAPITPTSDSLPEAVVKAIFADGVRADDILGPIEFVNALWLVKVEHRQEARTLPFEEAQELIRRELESQKRNRAIASLLNRLLQDSYIHPVSLKKQLEEMVRNALQ